MNLLQHLSRALRQYREFNAAWTELQRMSDGQLAKLGAERGDITRLAYERAEQRADVMRERPVACSAFVGRAGGLAASAG